LCGNCYLYASCGHYRVTELYHHIPYQGANIPLETSNTVVIRVLLVNAGVDQVIQLIFIADLNNADRVSKF